MKRQRIIPAPGTDPRRLLFPANPRKIRRMKKPTPQPTRDFRHTDRQAPLRRMIRPSTGERSMKARLPLAFCARIFVAPVAVQTRRAAQ